MKRITYKTTDRNGLASRKKVNLKHRLNYSIADLLNKAHLNEYQLPIHHCDPPLYPDYIALNTEKSKHRLTPATALGFYTYDRTFDKPKGLYNAIYYNDKKRLAYYKNLYSGIRFVIGPDYSLFDDIWQSENESRLLKIRVLMLWFVNVIGSVVIPNVPYVSKDKLPKYLSGFEYCTVMCFSTKGHIRYSKDRRRIKETVKYVVDHFSLKKILVYSVCSKDENSLKLFEYATSKGVSVSVVDNTLRRRNQALLSKEAV